MEQYKVKTLSLGALGNRILNSGDICTAADFPAGHVPELLKQGFITVLTDSDRAAITAAAEAKAEQERIAKEQADKIAAEQEAAIQKAKEEAELLAQMEKDEAEKKAAAEAKAEQEKKASSKGK